MFFFYCLCDMLVLSCSFGCLSCDLCLTQNQFAALNLPKKDNSQIEGPSIANSYGFKISMQNLQDAKALHEVSCNNEDSSFSSEQVCFCIF